MRYWWVNQNQTYRQEIDGGYLWSPKRKANGGRNPFYEFMREVAPGDFVFSFAKQRILAIGFARSYAYEATRPWRQRARVRSHFSFRSISLCILLVLLMCTQTSCAMLKAMGCTPEITTDHFPDGTIGTPYAAKIETTCKEWSQAIRVLSGYLPAGLELTYVEGEAGISGTPTVAGTFAFTLQMAARPGIAKQLVEKDLSIKILP